MSRREYNLLTGRVTELPDSPAEPQEDIRVPARVLMHRARLALLDAGLLGSVEAALAQLPQPARRRAQIEWEFSPTLDRNHGLVPAVATALGLTDAQIDNLFLGAGAV